MNSFQVFDDSLDSENRDSNENSRLLRLLSDPSFDIAREIKTERQIDLTNMKVKLSTNFNLAGS